MEEERWREQVGEKVKGTGRKEGEKGQRKSTEEDSRGTRRRENRREQGRRGEGKMVKGVTDGGN